MNDKHNDRLCPATLVVKDGDIFGMPVTLGSLAEGHYMRALREDMPISEEAAWICAKDEIHLGGYRFLANPRPR